MNDEALQEHLMYVVPEMRLVLIKESNASAHAVYTPADIEKLIEPLKYYSEEYFVSFHLDAKNQVTGYQIISHGTITESLVHPREIFKAALIANSYAIIIAHNHPSGSLMPSNEDIKVTQVIINAGELLGVRVLDHIIVSPHGGICSLREIHNDLWPTIEVDTLRLKNSNPMF